MKKILLVEDEGELRKLLLLYLKKEGYEVTEARDGEEALRLFKDSLDFVILDLMLPKVNGLDVLKEIRKKSNVPILILTAKGEEIDRILGFELGADDYLVKPFSMRELILRIKARERKDIQTEQAIRYKDLTIFPDKHVVKKGAEELNLTRLEFKILFSLIKERGKVITRDRMLDLIYEDGGFVIDRTVDAHIKNLRKKLDDDPDNPQYIFTIRGVGYKTKEE